MGLIIYVLGYIAIMVLMFYGNRSKNKFLHTTLGAAILLSFFSWFMVVLYTGVYIVETVNFKKMFNNLVSKTGYNVLQKMFEGK